MEEPDSIMTTERFTLDEMSKAYTRAVEKMQSPYKKVVAPKSMPRQPKFMKPPQVMRSYFGVEDNNGTTPDN